MGMKDKADPFNQVDFDGFSQTAFNHYNVHFGIRTRETNFQFSPGRDMAVLFFNLGDAIQYQVQARGVKNGLPASVVHTFSPVSGEITENEVHLVYLPPRSVCRVMPSGTLLSFSICFSPVYLAPLLRMYAGLSSFVAAMHRRQPIFQGASEAMQAQLSWALREKINALFDCVIELPEGFQRETFKDRVDDIIVYALHYLSQETPATVMPEPEMADDVYTFLRTENNFSVDQLARMIGMSSRRLQAGFKQLYGTSVAGLLRREYVRQARILLRDTGLPVEKIAARIGYSPSGFVKLFKRAEGCTPLQFRNGDGAS